MQQAAELLATAGTTASPVLDEDGVMVGWLSYDRVLDALTGRPRAHHEAVAHEEDQT